MLQFFTYFLLIKFKINKPFQTSNNLRKRKKYIPIKIHAYLTFRIMIIRREYYKRVLNIEFINLCYLFFNICIDTYFKSTYSEDRILRNLKKYLNSL